MTAQCTRDDVESLLDHLRHESDWKPYDWDYTVGMYDDAELELTLRWDPQIPEDSDMVFVLEIIEEEEGADGASHQTILEAASDEEAAEQTLERLKQQGEIYEPQSDHYRRT